MALPVYCSPEDAFRLSDCPDPWVFVQKLHHLLLEGMPSTARRNVRGSEREDVPRTTWVDCRPILFEGWVLSKKFRRYSKHPNGHTISERREFHGYDGKGSSLIGQTWSDDPVTIWLDLQFLTADFEAAWAKLFNPTPAPSASRSRSSSRRPPQNNPSDEAIMALIRTEAAGRGGFINQKDGSKLVRGKYSGVKDEHARRLVKAVTKNEKTGPKGPRKKLAGKLDGK